MCFTVPQNSETIKLLAACSGVKSFSQNSIMIKMKQKKTILGTRKLNRNDKLKPVSIYLNEHEIATGNYGQAEGSSSLNYLKSIIKK
ncbi:hypothetical protein [Maribacter sp.]|uniref:hypothetical protein n=1 Tax=Maribacter sp. TaxID=1897614 RepID=UPI003297B195